MSSFIQHEGHAGADLGDTFVMSRLCDPSASPWEPIVSRQAPASTTAAQPTASVIQFRDAQKSANRDLLMAAAMGGNRDDRNNDRVDVRLVSKFVRVRLVRGIRNHSTS